jgi:hypothetical protein
MTEVETATKTLNDLMDTRDQLVGRSAKLVSDCQAVAYAAHTGDKGARERLRKINDESVLHNAELEGVDAAITEANARLAAAQRNEVRTADRTNAEQLRAKLSRFTELGLTLDDCITDFVGAANEMNAVLNDIHALGCPSPNAAQMRVLGTLAVKSFVMQIPWTSKEWEHLPPNQRKTFASLVAGWRDMIDSNIAARLGDQQEKAA